MLAPKHEPFIVQQQKVVINEHWWPYKWCFREDLLESFSRLRQYGEEQKWSEGQNSTNQGCSGNIYQLESNLDKYWKVQHHMLSQYVFTTVIMTNVVLSFETLNHRYLTGHSLPLVLHPVAFINNVLLYGTILICRHSWS